MTTFDSVIPRLLRVCEQAPFRDQVSRYCVVRDVRGRVRVVLDISSDMSPAPSDPEPILRLLQESLTQELGGYFVPPVFALQGLPEVSRLARNLFDRVGAHWPAQWPRVVTDLLGNELPLAAETKWLGIERTIGKEAWLTSSNRNPVWPLVRDRTPSVITFHSFKGGVGRTTLLATYALHLARQGKRVAVVDLDLEAPGLAHVFGVGNQRRGVIDVLIDQIATTILSLSDAHAAADLSGVEDGTVDVFPAGVMNDQYISKLARLDFSSAAPDLQNPVGLALVEMLKKMKKRYDVILLDSRAGLHDIAGISLHGLAHVDVLVFRGTAQGLSGLEQTLRSLRANDGKQLVLVETLLPSDDDAFHLRHEITRRRVYDLLVEHRYPEDDPPQSVDLDEPHDVLPVRRKEWLDGLDDFRTQIDQILADTELNRVARRLDDACYLGGNQDQEEAGA